MPCVKRIDEAELAVLQRTEDARRRTGRGIGPVFVRYGESGGEVSTLSDERRFFCVLAC